jgi:4'-phosphopantetheinyl transferase
VLSERERADVRSCAADAQQSRFLEFWTLKEAFLKAVGRGITIPLRSVEFGIAADGQIRFDPAGAALAAAGADRWHFELLPRASGHRMAIATTCAQAPEVTLREWRA